MRARTTRAPRLAVRTERGLTLLEVLAAVAILGIVYTLLADWAIQGLLAEGEARRRLDASLVADRVLGELEAAVEAGNAPPLGVEESEQDGFAVRVEVTAVDLVQAGLEAEPLETRDRRRQEAGESGSFLAAGAQGAPSAMRRIHVSVTWEEGLREVETTRTTFALDREPIRALLEQLDAEAIAAAREREQRG